MNLGLVAETMRLDDGSHVSRELIPQLATRGIKLAVLNTLSVRLLNGQGMLTGGLSSFTQRFSCRRQLERRWQFGGVLVE